MPPLGAIFKLVGGLGLIGLIVGLLMMAAVVVIPVAGICRGSANLESVPSQSRATFSGA